MNCHSTLNLDIINLFYKKGNTWIKWVNLKESVTCLISKNDKAEKLKPMYCTVMPTTSHNGSDTTEVSIYCGWYFYNRLEVQYLIMAKENNLFCFIHGSYVSNITSRSIFPKLVHFWWILPILWLAWFSRTGDKSKEMNKNPKF